MDHLGAGELWTMSETVKKFSGGRSPSTSGVDSFSLRLLDQCDCGIVLIGHDRRILIWNDWFADKSDVSKESALELPLEAVFPDLPANISKAVDNAIRLGLSAILSYSLNRRQFPLFSEDGKRHLEQTIIVRPVAGFFGESVALIQIFDSSKAVQRERMLKEEHRKAVQASNAKSEFLANMSHELRTPLNSILGFAESMKNGLFGNVENEEHRDYLGIIQSSGSHLLNLINDILDVSKVEAGMMKLDEHGFALKALIDRCVTMMQVKLNKEEIFLTVRIPDDLPDIYADEIKVKQIFVNLLSNAVKFTSRGGRVDVTCALNEEKGIVLSVEDKGIGISGDDLKKLFQPFTQVENVMTRSKEGTGLGLTLVRAISELHGGTVEIQSEPGEGTNVTVTFPPERTLFPDA